jgi:hypothetical protein
MAILNAADVQITPDLNSDELMDQAAAKGLPP